MPADLWDWQQQYEQVKEEVRDNQPILDSEHMDTFGLQIVDASQLGIETGPAFKEQSQEQAYSPRHGKDDHSMSSGERHQDPGF
ncbi:MAG: hypothetical protein L6R39_000564 [Caloplaca ligustica]|nr:MAG: hypothetical protein L6R39_000564 [Caloplaca ligustica]